MAPETGRRVASDVSNRNRESISFKCKKVFSPQSVDGAPFVIQASGSRQATKHCSEVSGSVRRSLATNPTNRKLFLSKESTRLKDRAELSSKRGLNEIKHQSACTVNKLRDTANVSVSKEKFRYEGRTPKKEHEEGQYSEVGASSLKKSNPCLPEKLSLLNEFYDALEGAISLLRIRRQVCTFSSICGTIESLTKRRFLPNHLLKMKHILPEALHLDYITTQDPDTLCARKDMRITLLPLPSEVSTVKGNESVGYKMTSQTVRRRKEFGSRLLHFAESHPQEEVPEVPLLGDSSKECTEPPAMKESGYDSSISKSNHKSVGSCGEEFCEEVEAGERTLSENAPLPPSVVSPLWIQPGSKSHKSDGLDAFVSTSHFPPPFKPFFSQQHFPKVTPENLETVGLAVTQALQDESCSLKSSVDSQATLENASISPLFDHSEANPKSRRQLFNVDDKDSLQHLPASFKPHFSKKKTELTLPCRLSASSFQTTENPVPPSSFLSSGLPFCSSDDKTKEACSTEGSFSCQASTTPQTDKKSTYSIMTPSQYLSPSLTTLAKSIAGSEASPLNTPCYSSPQGTPLKSSGSSLHRHKLIKSLDFNTPIAASPVPIVPKGDAASDLWSPISSISQFSPSSTQQATIPKSNTLEKVNAFSDSTFETPSGSSQCKSQFRTPRAPVRARSKEPLTLKRSKVNLEPLFSEENSKVKIGDLLHFAESEKLETKDSSVIASPQKKQRGLHSADRKFSTNLEIVKSIPLAVLQSIHEKEQMIHEQEKGNLAQSRRRQQMLAGLPQLFNVLRLTFQSQNRSVMPRRELFNKILSSYNDITDQIEVEDRMKLMLELAPEWISTKISLSGESLYSIQKDADITAIRKRLAAAHKHSSTELLHFDIKHAKHQGSNSKS